MTNKPTFKCKLLHSSLVLNVVTAGTKGIAASIFNNKHVCQTVFSTADLALCRINLFEPDGKSELWIDGTCFAITRSAGENLAKTFDIRIATGAAA